MPTARDITTTDTDVQERVLVEFLSLIASDRLSGGVKPLRHYLDAFPEHETLIAQEYLSISGAVPASGPPALAHDGASGTTLGDYAIQKELGRGGQAIVYLAEDRALHRLVALKVVPPNPLSQGLSRRLDREARVTSRLEHPGICPVYAVGSSPEGEWIAMRYIEGRNFAEVLAARLAEDSQVDPLEDVALVEAVALAVDAAHQVGVVHRDVKPANLMVQTDGNPVVLDFGLAHHEDEQAALTRSGTTPGTPAYMAPEQLSGEALDARTDVWALGAVLYEALTGRRPFEAPTHTALVQAISRDALPDPRRLRSAISRDLSVVLQAALCKEPEGRYSSAKAFADDLACLRAGRPVSARPAGVLLKLRRWATRNPVIAGSLSLVLIVLVAATIHSTQLLGETREALNDRTIALEEKGEALVAKETALADKDIALAQKQQALDDEAAALAQVTRLADLRSTSQLREEEQTLWPAVPELADDLALWLDRADRLLARREAHNTTLEAVVARLETTGAATAGQRSARLDRDTDMWLSEQLTQLIAELTVLAPQRESVASRYQFATSLEANTLEAPAEAWEAALAHVAADSRFDGFDFVPQLGLVPLGPDPASGLVEFAVYSSGAVPSRDESGALLMEEASAVVLVLVPGGHTRLGAAQPAYGESADAPNADVHAVAQDGPVVEVTLDPFFISKYELTQGQWLRHTGDNQASYRPGNPRVDSDRPLLHPMETINWYDAERVLSQLGLRMPSEAQWEYAARAGTTSDWWTGDGVRSIEGAANVGDLSSISDGGSYGREYEPWLTDGWVIHAPVGQYRANAFGIHDVIGNVAEWCGDLWQHWGLNPPRDGDGMSIGVDEVPVYRGGTYDQDARSCRSACRNGLPAQMSIQSLGVRPARAVTPRQ